MATIAISMKERNFIENKIIPTLPALPVDVSCISLHIFSIARIFSAFSSSFVTSPSLCARAEKIINKKWNRENTKTIFYLTLY